MVIKYKDKCISIKRKTFDKHTRTLRCSHWTCLKCKVYNQCWLTGKEVWCEQRTIKRSVLAMTVINKQRLNRSWILIKEQK